MKRSLKLFSAIIGSYFLLGLTPAYANDCNQSSNIKNTPSGCFHVAQNKTVDKTKKKKKNPKSNGVKGRTGLGSPLPPVITDRDIPRPATRTVNQPGSISDLKILTHNMYFITIAGGEAFSEDFDERSQRIQGASYLSGQDVLVLSELFHHGHGDDILNSLRREYPYQTPVAGRNASRESWDQTLGEFRRVGNNSGTALVSKWPIEYKAQYLFPSADSCGTDRLANKGFIYARINYKRQQKLHVIGTHLQSDGCSDQARNGYMPGWRERDRQLRAIKRFIAEQRIPADEPIVVAGDLNVIKGTSEYNRMLQALNAADAVTTGHNATWDPRYNRYISEENRVLKPQVLDYVLMIKDGLMPTTWHNHVLKNDAYSDHYAVAASVRSRGRRVIVNPSLYKDYHVKFKTGSDGSNSDVYATLIGSKGRSAAVNTADLIRGNAYEDEDTFTFPNVDVGEIRSIKLTIDNMGVNPDWEVIGIDVQTPEGLKSWSGNFVLDEDDRRRRSKTFPLSQVERRSLANYRVRFKTGSDGSNSDIYATLIGTRGRSSEINTADLIRGNAYEDVDLFTLRNQNIGDLRAIQLRIDNMGVNPDWEVVGISVTNQSTGEVKRWNGEFIMDESESRQRVKRFNLE